MNWGLGSGCGGVRFVFLSFGFCLLGCVCFVGFVWEWCGVESGVF